MAKKAKTKKYNNLKNPKTGLTIKQQRLVDKYKGKGSLKKAAEYAGLTFSYACQVIQLTHVKKAILDKQEKLQKKTEVDQEWLIERYKKLADYHITDFFNDDGNMKPLSEIPMASIYAICGLDVNRRTVTLWDEEVVETFIQKFKLADKKGSLDSIAKTLGLVIDKSELIIEVKPLVVFDDDEPQEA